MRRSGPRRSRWSRRRSCPAIPAARSPEDPLTACVRGDNRGSKGGMSTRPARLTLAGVLLLAAAAAPRGIAHAFEVVLNAQGEYCDASLVNGKPFPPRVAFIDPDPPDPACLPSDPACVPPRVGRHVNGKLCFFPRRAHRPGQFVLADDAYREACPDSHPPQPRRSAT